jgi:Zn-dependent protease with chaperone function
MATDDTSQTTKTLATTRVTRRTVIGFLLIVVGTSLAFFSMSRAWFTEDLGLGGVGDIPKQGGQWAYIGVVVGTLVFQGIRVRLSALVPLVKKVTPWFLYTFGGLLMLGFALKTFADLATEQGITIHIATGWIMAVVGASAIIVGGILMRQFTRRVAPKPGVVPVGTQESLGPAHSSDAVVKPTPAMAPQAAASTGPTIQAAAVSPLRPKVDAKKVKQGVGALGDILDDPLRTSTLHWPTIRIGLVRAPLSVLIAVFATWTYLWLAVWIAVGNGITGALVGGAVAAFLGHYFLPGSGMFFGLVGGVIAGVGLAVVSLLAWLYILTTAYHGRTLIVSMVCGLAFGILITLISLICEPMTLRMHGYRRLSQRERGRFDAVLKDVSTKMKLGRMPRILVSDSLDIGAWTYPRSLVFTRRTLQLEHFELAGIVAHELEHWRRGDATTSTLVRGCAAPLALLTNLQYVCMRYGGGWVGIIAMLVLWPAVVLSRFVVAPIVGIESRKREYACDAAAVKHGFGPGLLKVLEEIQIFEPARGGWDRIMTATHPPIELRMERIEQQLGNQIAPLETHPIATLAAMVATSAGRVAPGFFSAAPAPAFVAHPVAVSGTSAVPHSVSSWSPGPSRDAAFPVARQFDVVIGALAQDLDENAKREGWTEQSRIDVHYAVKQQQAQFAAQQPVTRTADVLNRLLTCKIWDGFLWSQLVRLENVLIVIERGRARGELQYQVASSTTDADKSAVDEQAGERGPT